MIPAKKKLGRVVRLWILLSIFSAPNQGAAAESCAALLMLVPETPCEFDFHRYRAIDPRLDSIENSNASRDSLSPGKKYLVRNATEFNTLGKKIQPGDQIILANGVWQDQQLRLDAYGRSDRPILIRPETPNGVEFRGASSFALTGKNLIAYDLSFRHGALTEKIRTVFRLGVSTDHPCDFCIADHITIDDFNGSKEHGFYGNPNFSIHYVGLIGRDITLAHSIFTNKINPGTLATMDLPKVEPSCPQDQESEVNCFQRFHVFHNQFSNFTRSDPKGQDKGLFKFIQLGWSGISTRSSYSIIEENVFEDDKGRGETISIKASDVIVRNNLFKNNLGVLNLRSANRVLVKDNTFDGADQSGMGGVRIEGRSHWLIGNTFRHLKQPRDFYYWPVSLHSGADEYLKDESDDYAVAKNIVIAKNRFEDCESSPIAIGIYPDTMKRPFSPSNIFIINNNFSPASSIPVVRKVDPRILPERIYFKGNTGAPEGFQQDKMPSF